VARWMCSFDTTDEDVREFAEFVRNVVRDLPS
jgi:threonine aldolase